METSSIHSYVPYWENILKEELQQPHLLQVNRNDNSSSKTQELCKNADVWPLYKQIETINNEIPGGFIDYVKRGKRLLENTKKGITPLEGYTLEYPILEKIDTTSKDFIEWDRIGTSDLRYCAFALVAGGLGERLGYNGIKIEIPFELTTECMYIEYYAKMLLAYQNLIQSQDHQFVDLPLIIMTGKETDIPTKALLKKHNFFGLKKEQVFIMQQPEVPTFSDIHGHLATKPDDPTCLDMKPHGHGDIHHLIYSKGLSEELLKNNCKWLVFFQDTNSLTFHCIPAVIGVSKKRNFVMNVVTVSRQPNENVGAMVMLKKDDSNVVCCIEYNYLESTLKSSGFVGDVPDENGYSKFPGNTNIIVMNMSVYHKTLEASKGAMPEIINPKFKDNNPSIFKSSARLECLMQDYSWIMSKYGNVACTNLPREFCFSSLKNNLSDARLRDSKGLAPESALTSEFSFYNCNASLFQMAAKIKGCKVFLGPALSYSFENITCSVGPRIVIDPSWATSFSQMPSCFIEGGTIHITSRWAVIAEIGITSFGSFALNVRLHNLLSDQL
uniref:UTP-monosaccharide-1-phosphate uridylyltransferase n=1 Tax=Nephromyces sp. MMRI TaxID=2496275 RepID=A0A3S8V330_9APIC|nr:UDP-glucose pyrophosphorylase [Nephromyces sp. MMRI]